MIVVEIKAVHGLDNSHMAQIIGYLAVSGCPIGFLISFGERSLRYRRIFPPKKIVVPFSTRIQPFHTPRRPANHPQYTPSCILPHF
jgi:hypothetical protein